MPPPSPTSVTDLSPAAFPGAANLLSGFDDRREATKWDRGDQLLFGLRLRKGDEVRHWLLHLEVLFGEVFLTSLDGQNPSTIEWRSWDYYTTDEKGERKQIKLSSRMLPVKATVHDEHGKELGSSLVSLPVQLLGQGLLRAVDICIAHERASTTGKAPVAEADSQLVIAAVFGMMSLLSVVQDDDVLADYFWQVIEKPSIWSVMTSLGVEASLSMPMQQSVPATILPPHLPPPGRAFVVPVRIDVNGNAALLVDVIATDPARPYALCGGMVSAVARHPTRTDLHFDVQLLAARVGTGKATAKAGLSRDQQPL